MKRGSGIGSEGPLRVCVSKRNAMKKLFAEHTEKDPAQTAILLRGEGRNAEAVLRYAPAQGILRDVGGDDRKPR